ncbi:hypothetical protein R1CP_23545 [Rhodococcus opacus]|uniref:Uncharacterized protein n=1 Tax=Rhodococcus opacus TaxID=37919 RepID=A0A1B1K9T9_RHOOP|nr:hypothetical protein [Rhodococcus opacus]ANS29377.1 hypothetical protein R1CP_23545 [Rhodococcus opacus]
MSVETAINVLLAYSSPVLAMGLLGSIPGLAVLYGLAKRDAATNR